jgi:hypothetical protein
MSRRKNGSLMTAAVKPRSRFRVGMMARLAAAASVAATLPLASSGAAQAATKSASIVVSGTVIASSGRAEAGATVVIHAWPDQAVVQALKIGQRVPWVLVGTGRANASGRYSITMPVAKLAPEESYGVVNLEADSPSGTT